MGRFFEHVWAELAIRWTTVGHLRGFDSCVCSMDSDIRLVRARLCIPEFWGKNLSTSNGTCFLNLTSNTGSIPFHVHPGAREMEALQRFCDRVDDGSSLVVCYVCWPFPGCSCVYWTGRLHGSKLYTQELAYLLLLSRNGLLLRCVNRGVSSIFTDRKQLSLYLRSQNRFQKSQLAQCTLVWAVSWRGSLCCWPHHRGLTMLRLFSHQTRASVAGTRELHGY